MPKLAKRVSLIAESQTLAIDNKAKELLAAGEKVYNFSVGEPDIAPPSSLLRGIIKAFKAGKTKYTAPIGPLDVRKRIADLIFELDGLKYAAEEIALGSGGKQILNNIFQVILNPGEEVIILTPAWVSYAEQVKLAGGKPVFVSTDKNFDLDVSKVLKKINKKTKALIINSPCNPTGAVFSKEKLIELAKKIEKKNLFVVSDEIYQNLVYEGEFYTVASFSSKMREKTIIAHGLSKSHSMTGVRLGFCAASKEIIKAINKIQGQNTGNPCSLIQAAVPEVLDNSGNYEKKYFALFKKRRDFAEKILLKNKTVNLVHPKGAFYFFIDVSKIIPNSVDFCAKLLAEELVALVPGIAFGKEGFVRISFASSFEDLEKGLNKFNKFCRKYSK